MDADDFNPKVANITCRSWPFYGSQHLPCRGTHNNEPPIRHDHHAAKVEPAASLTDGEVCKLDEDAKKNTVNTGNKIHFTADNIGGKCSFTTIEPAK
jgi:hypothetical protein